MQIESVVNRIFSSKTYLIHEEEGLIYWLVDIGDFEIVNALLPKDATINGVFITHAHFDHIYGLEALVARFPECKVYVTEYAKQALASDKLNMSRYHGDRINYDKDNVVVVHEGESMILFEDEPQIFFYETPGHNPGCLTMVLGDFIFTGDAYIPGVGANTKLPKANKEQAKESLERILKLAKGKTVLSGHDTERSKIE